MLQFLFVREKDNFMKKTAVLTICLLLTAGQVYADENADLFDIDDLAASLEKNGKAEEDTNNKTTSENIKAETASAVTDTETDTAKEKTGGVTEIKTNAEKEDTVKSTETAAQNITAGTENKALEATGNTSAGDDYITEYFEDLEVAKKAQTAASALLEQKPAVVKLRDSQKRLIAEGEEKRKEFFKTSKPVSATAFAKTDTAESTESKEDKQNGGSAPEAGAKQTETTAAGNTTVKEETKTEGIKQKYEQAPFGLAWGADKEQIEKFGFKLLPAEREDYKNVYLVENPRQKHKTFDPVTAIFGDYDKLWCIYAQSIPQKDTPQASDVLKLYRTYYNALEQKYGNAHQYFTPATYTEELEEGNAAENQEQQERKPEENTNKSKEKPLKTHTVTAPIGNDNFLRELQSGAAELYATFENETLGITLGVSVDGDGKSYISVDYKNLKIMHEEEQNKLDNLISDI